MRQLSLSKVRPKLISAVVIGLAVLVSCGLVGENSAIKKTDSIPAGRKAQIVERTSGFSQQLNYLADRVEPKGFGVGEINQLFLSIQRFIEVEGDLPSSFSELAKRGYLFFQPVTEPIMWKISGDTLSVEIPNPSVQSGARKTLKASYYRPGSSADLEQKRRIALNSWKVLQHTLREKVSAGSTSGTPADSPWRKLSQEDFLEGRVSFRMEDRLRAYARDETEFAQLMWSYHLALILSQAAMRFMDMSGRYPKSPSELLDFLGRQDERGWISPMTGQRVEVAEDFTGKEVALTSSADGASFTILVPLFGAGSEEQTPPLMRIGELSEGIGFRAGEYFSVRLGH